jgi:hypothetical protein
MPPMPTTEAVRALAARWQTRSLALRAWSRCAAHELDLCRAELLAVLDGRAVETGHVSDLEHGGA